MNATPTVVVNGSPMPSVTGLSPEGACGQPRDRPVRAPARHAASALRVSGETPLPGRASAAMTLCSCTATVRVLCCTE